MERKQEKENGWVLCICSLRVCIYIKTHEYGIISISLVICRYV